MRRSNIKGVVRFLGYFIAFLSIALVGLSIVGMIMQGPLTFSNLAFSLIMVAIPTFLAITCFRWSRPGKNFFD